MGVEGPEGKLSQDNQDAQIQSTRRGDPRHGEKSGEDKNSHLSGCPLPVRSFLSQQVILKSEPVHPFGLAVYGEHIFWTDWVRRAVQRANKYVGSDMKLLRVDIPQQPMGIIAVANDTNSCE